jgi:hypothetical protein
MPDYYFLRQDVFGDAEAIEIEGHTPTTGELDWEAGQPFDVAPLGETLVLDAAYGSDMPDYFETTVPVMSARLLAALRDAGVDNIVSYPVRLQRNDTEEPIDGWEAINLIGAVEAMDLSRTPHRLLFGKPEATGPVFLSDERTNDLQAFRLVYGPTHIVITARIASKLAQSEFTGVLLQPTNSYDGD